MSEDVCKEMKLKLTCSVQMEGNEYMMTTKGTQKSIEIRRHSHASQKKREP